MEYSVFDLVPAMTLNNRLIAIEAPDRMITFWHHHKVASATAMGFIYAAIIV